MPDAKPGRGGTAPHYAELLERAEALIPVLRERAPRAEELRRLPDETIADLHKSGLFRVLQPKRVGGSELPFRALVELVAVISRGAGQSRGASLAVRHVAKAGAG
jgi:3-hydroxy-9,10-secoandrosta-1,3,5(10)-triene-9,17-dione monooxygenase